MSQYLGIVDIVFNKVTYDVEKGAKLKLGGYKQNPIVTNGKVGWAREFEASEVTATIPFKRGQRIGDVFPPGSMELQVNCDTGQSYTFADAFITNRPEMTGGEGGKVEIKWSAGDYQELLNA